MSHLRTKVSIEHVASSSGSMGWKLISVIARVCWCRTCAMALFEGRARSQRRAFWLEVEIHQDGFDWWGDHWTSATSHEVIWWSQRGVVKGSSRSIMKRPLRPARTASRPLGESVMAPMAPSTRTESDLPKVKDENGSMLDTVCGSIVRRGYSCGSFGINGRLYTAQWVGGPVHKDCTASRGEDFQISRIRSEVIFLTISSKRPSNSQPSNHE